LNQVLKRQTTALAAIFVLVVGMMFLFVLVVVVLGTTEKALAVQELLEGRVVGQCQTRDQPLHNCMFVHVKTSLTPPGKTASCANLLCVDWEVPFTNGPNGTGVKGNIILDVQQPIYSYGTVEISFNTPSVYSGICDSTRHPSPGSYLSVKCEVQPYIKGYGVRMRYDVIAHGKDELLTVTTNVHGGTKKPSHFTIKVTGTNPSQSSFSGSSSGTQIFLGPDNSSKNEKTAAH